jgi:transmembrane sensor
MKTPMQIELTLTELDNQALDWFVRRTDGLDATDEAAFQSWLAADPAHQLAFAEWQSDWTELDVLPAEGLARLRQNLAHDKARAAALQIQENTSVSHRPSWGKRLAAALRPRTTFAGAALAILFVGLFSWNYWWQPVFSQSYVTARGEQRNVVLPDGSEIQLDTASQIDVALYRPRREVRLPEGQAVFHVEGDRDRPFDVLAGPLRITVVGTRFSVRYTPNISGNDGVRIEVEEGHVRVARTGWFVSGRDTIDLIAGQQMVSNTDGTLGDVSNVVIADVAPWRENRISFDNIPLKQVLAEFERYGDTHLQLANTNVAALRLTGTFDPNNLKNFTRVLPYALPVHLAKAGSETEIRADK